MSDHVCHARGCRVPVPPAKLMCHPHWFQVPQEDRNLVWELYRPGQEISKTPSKAYVRETQRIIDQLAAKEQARIEKANAQQVLDL